ncbi:LysR family transcriptional regulator [Rhodoplanes roseus]|uniref:LysR family transcriptional regulator n=1 Tax=Rhodoplanes roseus TaxID=29409 RepID=A0A327L2M0_9BRAD|nr:LysR family transcriptional regulator [Rhodoplanes roseus]RAI44627.1 LysR family transcriptional regulator [Rhodoplanes roseus]
MTAAPLDIDTIRTFVLIADLKSFTRAAEALDTTQSAVSLKLKRLEERLGRRLVERTPRLVRLSADGQAFLEPARNLVAAHETAVGAFAPAARRLVIGISHHVIGAELPRLLRRLGETAPGVVLEMRIASSTDVLVELDRGIVDAAVVLQHDDGRRGGEILLEDEFGWIGAPDFVRRPGEPLRLAAQAEPCSVRVMAVRALTEAGIPWTEVFVGGGVATIGAAVAAGLAVAALARRVAPAGTIDHGPALGLPKLPRRKVALHATTSDREARAVLKLLAAAFRATA